MKRRRFTEEQIAFALRQHEAGTSMPEITRKLGVSEQTVYRWKRKYAGLGVAGQGVGMIRIYRWLSESTAMKVFTKPSPTTVYLVPSRETRTITLP